MGFVHKSLQNTENKVKTFFKRVRLYRSLTGTGRKQLIKKLQAEGSTLTISSLMAYENENLTNISFAQLNIYCDYFNISIEKMIEPLNQEEQMQFTRLKIKGNKQGSYLRA
jgi:hypothetical protein